MSERSFVVAGVTHVDLAWKWAAAEMSEMLEAVVVRILDALESDPTFKYTLEQAAHYRVLARTRPDLVRRLGEHLRSGRLEMAGCMASTLDTNVPSGESYVRNQLLGIDWVKKNWGVEPRTGWLMDTFGINAQVPQILRQFGLRHLIASRLGGDKRHDAFVARGLDGSTVTLVGRDVYSPHVKRTHESTVCYYHWNDLDRLFAAADELEGCGPFLVQPLTENEYLVSLRPYREARHRNATRPSESWTIGTCADYFELLDRAGQELPVEHADLNPEFSGCFSLRPKIRLRNRRAEGLLIEAEKWACLAGGVDASGLTDAWWDMAFVQFHDVFTGSHPTHVYDDVIATLDRIDAAATTVMRSAARALVGERKGDGDASAETLVLFNGLPWARSSPLTITDVAAVDSVTGVTDTDGNAVAFEVRGGALVLAATAPACGATGVVVRRSASEGKPSTPTRAEVVVLENEFLAVHLDAARGLRRVVWKPTGRVLVDEAGGLLVAQQDDGNFQIELPTGAEVPAAAGTMELERFPDRGLGARAVLRGELPKLANAGPDAHLRWSIEFWLPAGEPALHVDVRFDWKGEGTRVRLRVPTTIESTAGIYEVPFGTVSRKPYGTRGTARGEWPAQRFVLLQDGTHGVALANEGAPGVEVGGDTLTTSLVRAPKSVYSGMVPDATSSGHGSHHFRFAIVGFSGTWETSAVARVAQELNAPVHVERVAGGAGHGGVPSQVSLGPQTVLLSTVKRPEDGGQGEIVVRVYESAGLATVADLHIADAVSVRRSDLRETPGERLAIGEGTVRFEINPFEIVTLRVKRRP